MAKTILIADTEENTRETLKHILENHAALITVESQGSALEILMQKAAINAVFMGLHDDGGINTKIFEDIRERFPRLHVIAVGDYKSEEHAIEAVRQGATGYMIKPFKADEVLATVRKATEL